MCLEDSFTRKKWTRLQKEMTHSWDMTLWFVWNDAFTRVVWHMHICDMMYSFVWHRTRLCVRDMIPDAARGFVTGMWRVMRTNKSSCDIVCVAVCCSVLQYVAVCCSVCCRRISHRVTWLMFPTRLIHICDVTRSNVWRDSYESPDTFICVTCRSEGFCDGNMTCHAESRGI